MKTITNNKELETFMLGMGLGKDFYAIRTKGKIDLFETKRAFNKSAKLNPDAVQEKINAINYIWYRF